MNAIYYAVESLLCSIGVWKDIRDPSVLLGRTENTAVDSRG